MAYKITELQDLKKYFHNLFDVGIGRFIDTLMTAACARIIIDIVKFDEWIKKLHGDYERQGKSLADMIFEHYGDEAAALIDELL